MVVRDFRTTTQHGAIKGKTQSKNVTYYNLDMIISVGYRVKSHRGIHFRKWATALIKEYLVKGFAMNDELLKSAEGGNYFDELLARIRDIRSSEKVFWRKVLDVYSTSIDYDPKTENGYAIKVKNYKKYKKHKELQDFNIKQAPNLLLTSMNMSPNHPIKSNQNKTKHHYHNRGNILSSLLIGGFKMTISIRIDEQLYKKARTQSRAELRTIPAQIEYWARVGQTALNNPDLPVEMVEKLLIAKNETSEPFSFVE